MSRAMSGKAVAEPAIPLVKSCRRIAGSLPRYADDGFQRPDYSRDLRSAEWGSMINLRCKSLESRMSALGLGCVKTSGEKRRSVAVAMGRRYYAGIMS
jgi:hypothetical protein